MTNGSIIFDGETVNLETTQHEVPTQPEAQPEVSTQPAVQPEVQTQAEAQPPQTQNWKRLILDILETVILAVILYFGINAISARVRVDGFSMTPTLQHGEYVLVSSIPYMIGEPQRGDIIVFSYPLDLKQHLIKRVIGLPGETISIVNGTVAVNGQVLDEPYIAQSPIYNGEWTVGEDQLFVLGDNRNDSKDSHQWGYLPIEDIIGKALLIYWPPPEWKLVNHTREVFNGLQEQQDPIR
jgi:signal peptidase I